MPWVPELFSSSEILLSHHSVGYYGPPSLLGKLSSSVSTAQLFLNFPEASCTPDTKKIPNVFFYARLVSNPVINNEHYSFIHSFMQERKLGIRDRERIQQVKCLSGTQLTKVWFQAPHNSLNIDRSEAVHRAWSKSSWVWLIPPMYGSNEKKPE